MKKMLLIIAMSFALNSCVSKFKKTSIIDRDVAEITNLSAQDFSTENSLGDQEYNSALVELGFLTTPKGERLEPMDHYLATQYCAKKGGRLPTAREFAELAKSVGYATGIVDTCDSRNRFCKQIRTKNTDGTQDTFFYSFDGYQRPIGKIIGRSWFWTSSLRIDDDRYAFDFNGLNGQIFQLGTKRKDAEEAFPLCKINKQK